MAEERSKAKREGGAEARQVAYKYRIYPKPEQEREMMATVGCCRWVYNHFLRERTEAYNRTRPTLRRHKLAEGADPSDERPEWARDEDGEYVWEEYENGSYDPEAKRMTMFDTSKALTRLKKETVDEDGRRWLNDADSVALVYALRNLEAAYRNFFKRVKKGEKPGYPRYKRKGEGRDSYRTNMKAEWIDGGGEGRAASIRLPKVGRLRAVVHRPPEGEPYAATVSRDAAGRWFCCVSCKCAPAEPLPERRDMVGVTTGISEWLVTSDGEVVENPRRRDRSARRLARAQRKLSRKQGAREGERKSANYLKQQRRVAKLNAKVADQRADDTHKLTHSLVAEHGAIASREMRVRDMQQGNKKKGKVGRETNRKLGDANLSEINRQLAYKSEWAGRGFVLVPHDYPTAQTCSACGHKETVLAGDLRPRWTCPACGTRHHRKANGAVNVLDAANDILAGTQASGVSKARAKWEGPEAKRNADA